MIDFRIERSWSRTGHDIWIIHRHPQTGKTFIVEPIEMKLKELGEGRILPQPSIHFDEEDGKELFDAVRKAFSGQEWIDKDEWSAHKQIQKAMQAHIESLKLVVERVVK